MTKASLGLILFTATLNLLVTLQPIFLTEAGVVGVNYGLLGDNLPSPADTVNFIKSKNIGRIRMFEPNHDALNALQGSGIELVLGTLNQDLPSLAADPAFALQWVNTHVIPFAGAVTFRYIAAGNEVIPGDLQAHVLPAMQNLKTALASSPATSNIPVTTAVATSVLGASFPPSAGAFSAELMGPIAQFLGATRAPLLVNVYPYFSYISNPTDISLDYALLRSDQVVVNDGGLEYRNLFDAVVDAVYAALEKVGGAGVEIVISETGWPSAGNGDVAVVENAAAYNNNLIRHVASGSGTPRRPGRSIETYIFALYNEDLKPAGTEQNFGLFHPDTTEVYHVDFA